ncbi:MAG: DUF6456 domain-containing protein [Rhodospirillales bacterium]
MEAGSAGRRLVTKQRLRHDEFEDVETLVDGERATAKRVATQTPLDRYARRGLIDRRQHDAGQSLARDWHYARMEPRMIACYRDLIQGGGAADPAAEREHARRRLMRALAAVGRVAAGEVVGVCGLQRPAGGPVGMEILRRGLDVLADHYGL